MQPLISVSRDTQHTCLKVEPGLEPAAGSGSRVEEEHQPRARRLDPLGQVLAAELKVVAVVHVVLLLAANVHLKRCVRIEVM